MISRAPHLVLLTLGLALIFLAQGIARHLAEPARWPDPLPGASAGQALRDAVLP
jgi:hypothetical protein